MTCKVHVKNLHRIRIKNWEEIQRMSIEVFVWSITSEKKALLKSAMRVKAIIKAY
jgi:hypothetical protein